MTAAASLPNCGDDLTILVEGGARPLTLRAKAGRVEATTLLVPRPQAGASTGRWPIQTDDAVTVVYHAAGKLAFWRMRVEEILPSSYFLVSVRAPTADERRSFVRAHLALWIAINDGELPPESAALAELDISAAGFSMSVSTAKALGSLVQVDLADSPDSQILQAAGVVVRCDARAQGYRLAVHFVALASADEERLLQRVYRAREGALAERLGRRRAII